METNTASRRATVQPAQAGHTSLLAILRGTADPLAAVLCLGVATVAAGHPLRPAEVVLAVLAFLLQSPDWALFRQGERNRLHGVLGAWAITVGLLWLLGQTTGLIDQFDERVMLTWIAAVPMVQIAMHLFAPVLLRAWAELRGERRIVVVGAGELGVAFAQTVQDDPLANVRVLAFFDDRGADRAAPQARSMLAGKIAEVGRYVRTHHVDQIYIALPMASQPRILELLEDLRDTTASVYFVPDIFLADLIQARVDTLSGFPVVGVCESPFQGATGAIKRLFDITVASVALVLVAPVMLGIAIAIKATSPGPVIFAQRRYGLDGREIMVYKFRSMKVTEDGKTTYKQVEKGDPRVTRIGAFIRKTSLDELPQFVNVLQGRMSVVGPRPHAIAVNDQYRKLIPGYMVRHKVRPGITGWAQVNGYRGGDDLGLMTKRIEYDLDYLRNWSLALDLRILFRTVAIVFNDSKAY